MSEYFSEAHIFTAHGLVGFKLGPEE